MCYSLIIKLLWRILRNRLEDNYKLIEEQCGFSAGGTCTDCIFALIQFLEKQRDKGTTTELTLVYLEKFHDRVLINFLWNVLKTTSLNEKLISNFRKNYYRNSGRVKDINKLSESFILSKDRVGGSCLSVTLFKIYIHVCFRIWTKKWCWRGRIVNISTIYYPRMIKSS